MKKLVLVAALAVGAVGCEPEIAQDEAPNQVVVQFDPSASPAVVPSPNDLAIDQATGKVNAPIDPNSSPAQQEFTRDYLNSLNGFPTTAGASASVSAPLDPTSVTPATVRVLPLNAVAIAAITPTDAGTRAVTPTVSYDGATNRILVSPSGGGWPKGSRWGVAVVGGANGVKSASGAPVVASSTWTLLQSETPLANCPAGSNGQPDFTSADCTLGTNLIPSNVIDTPEARFADQLKSAKRLEQLRLSYGPVFAHPGLAGVSRQDVLLLWTWTTVAQPELAFDPTRSIIPFPNNLATRPTDAGVQLNLPIPDGGSAATVALLGGLNTLDGFSTTGYIVSENGDAVPALADPGSAFVTTDGGIVANGALIAQAASTAEVKSTPSVYACVNCQSSRLSDGGVQTLPQLQIVPSVPLDERSTYVAAVSTDAPATIRLLDGSTKTTTVMAPAAWALLRMKNTLVDSAGKSQISGVPDANAAALEPIRRNFQQALDAVEGTVPRTKMAIGTVFNTQSTVSVLKQLQGLPAALPAATATSFYMEKIAPGTRGVPATLTAVDVYYGSAFFPIAVTGRNADGSPNGTLNPAGILAQRAPFTLTVPKSTMPTAGYPLTQFGHGLTRNRNDVFAIATALAGAGRAALSFDTIFHGERSLCVGSAVVFQAAGVPGATDDTACFSGTCDRTPTSPTFGRCINTNVAARATCEPFTAAGDSDCAVARQGVCLPSAASPTGGICEGGDFRRGTFPDSANATDPRVTPPIVSGNILNVANLFATRDNFRHQVVDLSQMLRVARNASFEASLTAANGGTALKVNTAQIDYVGQSLGGILGTLYTSVSPDVQKATLNVPGGDLVNLVQKSESTQIQALYNGLKQGLAAGGTIEGTPAFDTFINFARTILDPADPQNMAANMKNGAGKPTGRDVLIQYITADQTVPNSSTDRLIAAANRPLSSGTNNQCKVAKWDPDVTGASTQLDATNPGLAGPDRHGFLLNFAGLTSDPTKTFTAAAQGQAVTFVASGNVTPIPPAAQ